MLLTALEQNLLSSAQCTIPQNQSLPILSHTHSAPGGQRAGKDTHSSLKGNFLCTRAQPEGDAQPSFPFLLELPLCAGLPDTNSRDPFSFSSPSLSWLLLHPRGSVSSSQASGFPSSSPLDAAESETATRQTDPALTNTDGPTSTSFSPVSDWPGFLPVLAGWRSPAPQRRWAGHGRGEDLSFLSHEIFMHG